MFYENRMLYHILQKQTYFSEEKNSQPVKHQNVSVLLPRLGSCVLSPSPSVVFPCFSVIMSVCLSSLCAKANKTNGQRKIPQNRPAFPMCRSSSKMLQCLPSQLSIALSDHLRTLRRSSCYYPDHLFAILPNMEYKRICEDSY